jgi:hypothetical protein
MWQLAQTGPETGGHSSEKQRRSERDGAMTLERFAEVLLMGAVAFALAVMALAVADVLAQLL